MNEHKPNNLIIFQAKNGAIELRGDFDAETIWATQKQMAEVFRVDVRTVNEHIKNIFADEELLEGSTLRNFRIVQNEGSRQVNREISHYNLDMIISVGYRVNSKTATHFRKWATQTLKQHITKGYTINQQLLSKKKDLYLSVMEDLKVLSSQGKLVSTNDVLDIVKAFSGTWFDLQSYDEGDIPTDGFTHRDLQFSGDELYADIEKFKSELIKKGEATELFAQEKTTKNLEGIFGNVMQSVFGDDAYPTIEEKAAHFLYFVVKNHPFNDGNKRTGAFCFLWFLRKSGIDFSIKITPNTLTALTLLVAQSDPNDKERIIGLILLMFQK